MDIFCGQTQKMKDNLGQALAYINNMREACLEQLINLRKVRVDPNLCDQLQKILDELFS